MEFYNSSTDQRDIENSKIFIKCLQKIGNKNHGMQKLIKTLISFDDPRYNRWHHLKILSQNIKCKGNKSVKCTIICKLYHFINLRQKYDWLDSLFKHHLINTKPEFYNKCPGCKKNILRKFLIGGKLFENTIIELLENNFPVNSTYNLNQNSILMYMVKNLRLNMIPFLLNYDLNVYHKNLHGIDVFDLIEKKLKNIEKILVVESCTVPVMARPTDKEKVATEHKVILRKMLALLKHYTNNRHWKLLFLARYKSPESPFYIDVFPLDMFKLIVGFLML